MQRGALQMSVHIFLSLSFSLSLFLYHLSLSRGKQKIHMNYGIELLCECVRAPGLLCFGVSLLVRSAVRAVLHTHTRASYSERSRSRHLKAHIEEEIR